MEGVMPHTKRVLRGYGHASRKTKSEEKVSGSSLSKVNFKEANKLLSDREDNKNSVIKRCQMRSTLGPLGISNLPKRQYFQRSQYAY
jgi:hypothetical protein